jgi:hypothetical protein
VDNTHSSPPQQVYVGPHSSSTSTNQRMWYYWTLQALLRLSPNIWQNWIEAISKDRYKGNILTLQSICNVEKTHLSGQSMSICEPLATLYLLHASSKENMMGKNSARSGGIR